MPPFTTENQSRPTPEIIVTQQLAEALYPDGKALGKPAYDMQGRPSTIIGIISNGEGWHNNHHAFPSSAAFGLKRREIDFGYWLIRLLEKLGLAWDVKSPSTAHIARRRERLQSPD